MKQKQSAEMTGQRAPETASQWMLLFRQDRCTGCGACVVACLAWNGKVTSRTGECEPQLLEYRNADTMRVIHGAKRLSLECREEGTDPLHLKRSYLPKLCMHCTTPACLDACPAGVLEKEPEYGSVRFRNLNACIGCGKCHEACPWGIPGIEQVFRKDGEKKKRGRISKCDLCADRLLRGLKPACVAACPLRALEAGPAPELLKKYPEAVSAGEVFKKSRPAGSNACDPNFRVLLKDRGGFRTQLII